MDSAHWIDLRSDTVTRPTPEMRAAMQAAPVGDDVFGEDPTVRHLEESLAERAGMEAGLYMPSGTQSNLVALLTHCARGDEYIVGQQAHTYRYEGGGAAVLGGIQPQPLEFAEDGTLDLGMVKQAIKPNDPHFARTRLLCLENTMQGKVLPMQYLSEAKKFSQAHGLTLHLDGARVFNAAVALDVELFVITRNFDTVSICLSKGLGAPVGSVLLGNQAFIQEARRWRKVAGGGMRQAGVIAAAGIYALEHHVQRLNEDHRRALRLADGLEEAGYTVDPVRSNMVWVDCSVTGLGPAELAERLAARQIAVAPLSPQLRLVTHLDISDEDVERVIGLFRELLG